MTATNKPMTGAQLDELMAVAMRMQSDSEKMGERPVSLFAYAVQIAVLEIREVRSKYEELQSQNADLAVQLANAESKCRELAAENSRVKSVASNLVSKYIANKGTDCEFISCITPSKNTIVTGGVWDMWRQLDLVLQETPAIDAFLAEVQASARNEGINYAASRLATAFNHGFVDKPLAEVCDVVRMILDTKEELANSTLPAADGISGEYAEKFLAEFSSQLRKGPAL